jgi:hypothetical protein
MKQIACNRGYPRGGGSIVQHPTKKKVDSKVPLERNEVRNKPGETTHPRRNEICWDSRARQKRETDIAEQKKNEQFATRADGPRASLPEEGGDPTPDGSLHCTPARAGSRRKVEERLGEGIACDIVEGRPRQIGPGRTRIDEKLWAAGWRWGRGRRDYVTVPAGFVDL